jgi:hypothetical protein
MIQTSLTSCVTKLGCSQACPICDCPLDQVKVVKPNDFLSKYAQSGDVVVKAKTAAEAAQAASMGGDDADVVVKASDASSAAQAAAQQEGADETAASAVRPVDQAAAVLPDGRR